MKLQIIATYDRVSKLYGAPMFVIHIPPAVRDFYNEVRRKDPKNVLSTNPHDFELWHLGEYDDEFGSFYTGVDGQHFDAKRLASGSDAKDFPAI